MSLLQFLQQTLIKDVSHHLLQQMQSEHQAVQSLLDHLSSLRSLDKATIIKSKMEEVKIYLNLKQSIYQSLNGVEGYLFEQWVTQVFSNSTLILQLVKIQRIKIEKMIIRTIRNIFILQKANSHEDAEQQEKLNYYLMKLNNLLEKERPSRQEVLEASRLDGIFAEYRQKFEQKVLKFNQLIQSYLIKMKEYNQKIRLQFINLLGKQPVDNQPEENGDSTPFKKITEEVIQQQYEHRYSPKNSQKALQYSHRRPQQQQTNFNFGYRREAPTRDIFVFDTI